MKPHNAKKRSLHWVALGQLVMACVCAGGVWAAEIPTPFEYRVLGWSDDSARWGFQERGDYGAGMVFSPGGGVYVIDAAANHFIFQHFSGTGDRALELGAAWAQQTNDTAVERDLRQARSLGLRGATGAVVYEQPKMIWWGSDSQFKQFGAKQVTFEHAGHRYTVRLQDAFTADYDDIAGTRSKFSVSIQRNGGVPHTLQSDHTHWRRYMAYRIVHISISPDGQKVAILVEAVKSGLEGQKQSYYKGVTGLLP
jgi:hypothetical protein